MDRRWRASRGTESAHGARAIKGPATRHFITEVEAEVLDQ